MRLGPLRLGLLDMLHVFFPAAVVLEIMHGPPVAIFGCAALAIIPLAGWMGRATEHLAVHYGPGVGGLVNASFGNAAELIIAFFALRAGLHDVVKASLTGSIIGNALLVLGLSFLLGGIRHRRQQFNRTAAGLGSTLLLLSAVGLLVPDLFHAVSGEAGAPRIQPLSLSIAVVLFAAYVLSLLFQLRTHDHLFRQGHGAAEPDVPAPWSRGLAIGVLVGTTVLIAIMSEMLVGSVTPAAEVLGMSEVFVGVFLVAIIGNAAEHSSAVLVAMKNKIDLSLHIAVGSGIQIALFAAPLLVFVSYAVGPAPLDLEFTDLEVISVIIAVLVVSSVSHDGESHWMEGVLLLAVYLVLGLAFFFLP